MTVHADGEFAPLQALIHDMPGGPMVNLASANEHVPEIERRLKPKLCLNILLLCTYTKAKRVYRPIDLNWF